MKDYLKQKWAELPVKQKQIIAIVGTGLTVMLVVGLFQPGDSSRERPVDAKTDQVRNVLTDRSSRGDQIDAISGTLNRQHDDIKRLTKEIETMKQRERQTSERQTQELKAEVEKLRNEIQSLQTDVLLPKSQDALFSQDNEGVEGEEGDDGKTGARSSRRASKSPQMNVIYEKKKIEKKPKEAVAPEAKAYIPAGSIITGTIITGGDFPTNAGGFENPTPLLIRISKEAILPNRYTSDIRECFLLTGGRGDLASERVKLRGEQLSCIKQNGDVIETKLNSYVSGEDGKEGVKGRLVSKQGQIIARSLVAGFASGLSEAFDVNAVPSVSMSSDGTVQYEKVYSSDAVQGAAVKGFSNAMERISDFYLDMAKDIFPVVEINAGRQVDVVVISGTELTVTAPGKFASRK